MFQGFFSFNIRGEDLNPNEITKILNLNPTRVKHKGEVIFKEDKMKDTLWSNTAKYNGYDELDQVLNDFLSTLLQRKNIIDELKKIYDTYIFFSFTSNLGQLGFELSPHVLKQLSDLGVRFEVHILSYGEVEDDDE